MLFRKWIPRVFILIAVTQFAVGSGAASSRHTTDLPMGAKGREIPDVWYRFVDAKLQESKRELAGNMAAGMPADYDEMPGSSYYKITPLFNPHPKPGQNWDVKNFGPVGLGITLSKPAFTMKIRNVEKGSPAAATGKLEKGQIIESINGKVLQDIDPRIILGNIITEAEATDGLIRLKIKDEGIVTVKIPVLGAYSETWPLDCPKSDKIVRNLADTLAKQESPRWGSVLFMLSTGNEKDLEVVRKWMAQKEKIGNGTYAWHAGYIGIGVCEYYLRTGDESVLPMIAEMAESLRTLMYNGGWSGRPGAQFTYSTGSGQMHAAGVHSLTFLLLAKRCGVDVDDYMLQRSLKAFYRFAGHENVPYGDGWPEGGFRDNGKTAGLAVAMAAAARLTPEGEDTVYADARDVSAMKSFYATSWFHAAHTGGGIGEIWHHAAMGMMYDKRPVQYRSYLDTRRWVMELSRRHDGSIGIAGVKDRYDQSATEHQRSWGTFFALTYTIPRQHLQLFGAPKTKWCKSYQLPERPWGRPADDAFVSPAPPDNAPLSWYDLHEETVRKDASLPFLVKTRPDDISDETLLAYLHHPESGIRTATMRRVVDKERDHLIVPMLKSRDPRVRHNALLAIKGMFKGKALPDERVTPEMFDHVSNIIEDPDESLWVVLEAMKAISRASPDVIAKHRDTILKYMAHDSWFVRDAAVSALAPICTDREHYQAILPLMIKTIAEFTTDAPAGNSTRRLAKKLPGAEPQVKAFASEMLKKTYAAVPPQMRFPGGYVVPNGANIIRSNLGALLSLLPEGETFVRSRPMITLAAARSGKEADKYRYTGTHEPNQQALGTWSTLWPRPESPEEFEGKMRGYVKKYDKPPAKPKDTMTLREGGKVKSKRFKGCFWSGDWLLDPRRQVARKMIFRTFEGVDFMFVESGGFDKADGSEDWSPGYYAYARRSDLASPTRPQAK